VSTSRRWTRKRVVLLAAVGAVVLAGGAAAYSRQKGKAVPVLAVRVEKQDIVSKVTANGKIQAENKVEMCPSSWARSSTWPPARETASRRGTSSSRSTATGPPPTRRGSSAALQASLADRDTARATMEQTERDFERTRRNYEARITSEAEFQKARSALETGRSALEAAEHRVDQTRAGLNANRDTLSKTTVRAPIDGVVTTLRVKAGEVTVIGTMNNPGTQLLTISDMSTVEAVLMVDETDTPSVQLGQKALLAIDAYPGRTFDGLVTEVGRSRRCRRCRWPRWSCAPLGVGSARDQEP